MVMSIAYRHNDMVIVAIVFIIGDILYPSRLNVNTFP